MMIMGAEEVIPPIIEPLSLYPDSSRLLTVQDGKQCIRPHGTSTCQELARTQFKHWRDMKVFHVTRCWLTLPPKPGHAHEFTELGYQTFNPRSQPAQADWMIELAGEVRPTDYALIWKLVNIRSTYFRSSLAL